MKWLTLPLLLAACGSNTPPAEAPEAASTETRPAAEDGPEAPEAKPATAANDCSLEIMLECDDGQRDGCTVTDADGATLTSAHVCTTDEKAGPPCEQEIARECGDGFVDACATTPPQAKTHVCVTTKS